MHPLKSGSGDHFSLGARDFVDSAVQYVDPSMRSRCETVTFYSHGLFGSLMIGSDSPWKPIKRLKNHEIVPKSANIAKEVTQ